MKWGRRAVRQRGRDPDPFAFAVAEHPRLTLHYLPPYAPDLNPAEGV
jgi:hypothetical protein